MSARNGDKARFGRLRKQKVHLRQRIRDMRAAMGSNTVRAAIVASPPEGTAPLPIEPMGAIR